MDLTGLEGVVLEMSEASQGEIPQVKTLELGVAVKVYSSPLLSPARTPSWWIGECFVCRVSHSTSTQLLK